MGVGYAIDEAGNIVQGTGNDLYYNSTRIPLVTTYRGVANAVRNGRVVGVNNGDQRAFMYSAVGGTVTTLPDYVDPSFTETFSIAKDLNDSGNITGISGAGRSQVLWQRQMDGTYKVYPLKDLVKPSSTPSIDPFTSTNNRDLNITMMAD